MRCHEARQRINESDQAQFDPDRDRELLEHLRSCRNCAELAQAEMSLRRDFDAVKPDDTEGGLSFSNLKSRVEKYIDSGIQQRYKEIGLMSKLINSVGKRPRLGLSLGIAVVLLAFLTLIPFKFERTIGYEVAIAGVDKDLALDTEKVQTLFIKLGLDEAKFDVSNCEATCNMKITHLKSKSDAQIIVAAFDELGNCTFEEINTIHSEHSEPLLWHIREGNVAEFGDDEDAKAEPHDVELFMEQVDGKTIIYVSQVVSQLYSDSEDSFSVWVTADANLQLDDNDTEVHRIISISLGSEFECDSIKESLNDLVIAGPNDFETTIHLNKDHRVSVGEHSDNPTLNFVRGSNGSREFTIVTDDGQIHRIDLNDENCVEKLRELGITVDFVKDLSDDDKKAYFIGDGKTYGDEKGEVVAESISPSATKFSNQLPEEYELQQNYPNPFNPATTIIYSLPKAERVLLEIYNSNGQKVRTLVDEVVSAGDHSVIWDATSDNNEKTATGIYLYKITAGDFVDSKKMSLVK